LTLPTQLLADIPVTTIFDSQLHDFVSIWKYGIRFGFCRAVSRFR